jgi:hypothetical protein
VTVHGIDVAGYQSSDYATSGLDFVFVKATEGHSYTNPKHAAQVATARAADLVVGHYHFARSGSMSAQADYFLAHAGAKPGDVLAFDWEDTAVSGAEKDTWLRYVLGKAPGHRLVLYSNRDFWLHRDRTSYAGSGLWIADPSAPKGHPRVEHPWLFHQYSEAGGLDRNLGNFADRAALRRWAGQISTEDIMTISAADRSAIAAEVWSHLIADPARPDSHGKPRMIPASSLLRSEDSHFDTLRQESAAQTGALTAALAALRQDGGLTAEQITAAAQAGAQAALAELGTALTKEG